MDKPPSLKPLYWLGSSKRDLLSLPGPVEDLFGYALYLAQDGRKHEQAKPFKGFGSAGVLGLSRIGIEVHIEPSTPYGSRAWCSCCTYSRRSPSAGRTTPKANIDLIRERLKVAEQFAKELSR